MIKKSKSYKDTSVNWGKSQAQIVKTLTYFGVGDIRFTFLNQRNEIICEFNYPTTFNDKDVTIGVRILWPLPEGVSDPEKAKNIASRRLFYYLKSKFDALSDSTIEFAQEFMPHLIVFDKKGGTNTLWNIVGQQYQSGLISGQQGELKMLPDHTEAKP